VTCKVRVHQEQTQIGKNTTEAKFIKIKFNLWLDNFLSKSQYFYIKFTGYFEQ